MKEVNKITIDVLMSTMNQIDYDLVSKSNMKSGVVVNQTNRSTFEKLNDSILWVNSKTKGLSKSRNICLSHSAAEFCLIADDDLEYVNEYEQIIKDAFNQTDADILCFKVEGIEKKFKNYSDKMKKIGYLDALQVSSVEIALRRDSIVKKKLSFDEHFGSGSIFSMGEENIFLYDSLKKKLKIIYIPIKIADLHIGTSSWFKGFDENYLINRGAIFYRMSQKLYPLLIFQFALRKKPLFKGMNIFKIINKQFLGVKIYKEMKAKK